MRCNKKYNIIFYLLFSFLFFNTLFTPNELKAQNQKLTNLFLSVPSIKVLEGERVTVNIEINSPQQSINAVSGVVYFPGELVRVVSLNKNKSIINLWTQEPKLISNKISFEGIILNPGFQGKNGIVFSITFEAKNTGKVILNFSEGAILANDGRGTNVLATLESTSFNIIPNPIYFTNRPIAQEQRTKLVLPVITKYFPILEEKEVLFLRGKGKPDALTKIIFQDVSVKSIGEKLIALLQNEKKELGEVVVKNDENGLFHYVSGSDLAAGVYNATPFLVNQDKNIDIPGASVQLLVNDSVLVRNMVVILNAMGLMIPIILFAVIIFFIPWYSWRKMHLMKAKMLLEEEKIDLTGHQLERQDKILDQNVSKIADEEKK